VGHNSGCCAVCTSRQEDTGRLLRDDIEQIQGNQDLRKLLTVLSALDPDALRLLCDLVALTKVAKKDPELMSFFTSLLTLGCELH